MESAVDGMTMAVDWLCLRKLVAVGVGWLAIDSCTLNEFAFEIS